MDENSESAAPGALAPFAVPELPAPQGCACAPAQNPADIVPSVEQLQKLLVIEPSTSLFYSGYKTLHDRTWLDWAKSWRSKTKTNYLTIDEMLGNTFWKRASEAMAKNTQGTAYVVLPRQSCLNASTDWYPNSVWNNIEFKALKDNPKVDKLIRVEPFTGEEEIVFSRTTALNM